MDVLGNPEDTLVQYKGLKASEELDEEGGKKPKMFLEHAKVCPHLRVFTNAI